VRGLSIRRTEGLPPLTVICCDNMTSNGRKLGGAVSEFASRIDRGLRDWIDELVRFPNTMVDSITPATDDALRSLVRDRSGFDDSIPVRRESYSEWVIEDVLPPDAPDLRSVGAVLATDVGAWEKAKLRVLNGSHSSLAYIGLLLGHETVADAMGDQRLSAFVDRLAAEDIIPSLQPSPLDLDDYALRTFARFRNPAIHHKLSQIAWDGSQKLPYRLLDTANEAAAAGRPLRRLAIPVAAWFAFLQRRAREGGEIVDPLADKLRKLALERDAADALLNLRQVFPESLSAASPFGSAVKTAFRAIGDGGTAELLVCDESY
jgi:fructuronate reductase